jgi:hypothetical protein
MADQAPRIGMVVLARSDPQLVGATLQSVAHLRDRPEVVSVLVPRPRAHLFEGLAEPSEGISLVRNDGPEDSALAFGFNAMAPQVDIVLLVPEGIVFEPGYLGRVRDTALRWQDVVGRIDLVTRIDKMTIDAATGARTGRRDWPWLPRLRRWLRARSMLACVFWVRVAACGNIKFRALPEFCDFLAFALFLDALRPRGRTAALFPDDVRQLRFVPERRTGFDIGYALYSKLGQLAQPDDATTPSVRRSYLRPRLELWRLIGEQGLQVVVSPHSKRHVLTFIKGMLAARRAMKATRQAVRRDIRDL